ncbi:tetratricopeptide repeat protein [Streptomyces sp. Ag82_O1-15]|uniref:tetratricopeptide repeat protein n=1 Tax=Streptomyces sp. Ag82_O1-15 TaxID=1938855 RepID=UPI0015CB319E|nr:tetratricopeptide repeat protein [Streptomyces sp. Ag82_O1-15]
MRLRLSRGEVTGPDALADARRLASVLRDGDLEATLPLGLLYFARFEVDHDDADLDQAADLLGPCFVAGVEDLPSPLVPLLAAEAVRTAIAWYGSGPGAADTPHLTATIDLFRRILAAIPADHPRRTPSRSGLAIMLADRGERLGMPTDLDEAITIGRRLAGDLSAGDPNRGLCLSNLAMALLGRHEYTGDGTDLDESIEASRATVEDAAPDEPARGKFLSTSERHCWHVSNAPATTEICTRRSTLARRRCAPLPPGTLTCRRSGPTSALPYRPGPNGPERATTTLSNWPGLPFTLSPLATSIALSFSSALGPRCTSAPNARVSPRTWTRPSRSSAPAGGAGRLNNLANALRLRHDRTGARADLDAAVLTAEEAVRVLPAGHVERPLFVTRQDVVYVRGRFLAPLAVLVAVRAAMSVPPQDRVPAFSRFVWFDTSAPGRGIRCSRWSHR